VTAKLALKIVPGRSVAGFHKTNIATKRGKLLQATLNQTSNQSVRQSEYVRGVLVSDVTTPTNMSDSKDLLMLLKPLFDDNQVAQNSNTWQ
jgi:hypothetical protein